MRVRFLHIKVEKLSIDCRQQHSTLKIGAGVEIVASQRGKLRPKRMELLTPAIDRFATEIDHFAIEFMEPQFHGAAWIPRQLAGNNGVGQLAIIAFGLFRLWRECTAAKEQ
jgi:hypothetical protein